MHIRRVESSIQMYSEATKSDPTLHLQEGLMDYLNPSNRTISCHSENKQWPPVLHLFVMADLQAGMIYLKIRTSRKMQEVSSTFQSDFMNKVTVNFGHKIFESLQVCGQTGSCPAQLVFVQIQKRHEFNRIPGKTGNHGKHIWDEQNCTNLKNCQQCQREHDMVLTTPNTRQIL